MGAISLIEAEAASGLHPSQISIERTAGGLTLRIIFQDWAPSAEIGENLPHHNVTVDLAKLPPGVSVSDMSAWPDAIHPLPAMSLEQIEAEIAAIASYGLAPDWAAFGDPGQPPQRWITKPIKWLPEPLRSALIKKYHGKIKN